MGSETKVVKGTGRGTEQVAVDTSTFRPTLDTGQTGFYPKGHETTKGSQEGRENSGIQEPPIIQQDQKQHEISQDFEAIRDKAKRITDILDRKVLPSETEQEIRAALGRLLADLGELERQGKDASPAQTLILMVVLAQLETIITPEPNDPDRAVKEMIGKHLKGLVLALWNLLARIGTVREWSVHGDIEVTLLPFFLKGTGGIDVTFAR